MQQQVCVITLGIEDLERSKRFYADGFGWKPVFENEEIAFYQMNGFVLETWLRVSLEKDMQRDGLHHQQRRGGGETLFGLPTTCRARRRCLQDQSRGAGARSFLVKAADAIKSAIE